VIHNCSFKLKIAVERRLLLVKVAGGKRKNTELDIIRLTYLPEVANTNTKTTIKS
jgi:hypothetical protein